MIAREAGTDPEGASREFTPTASFSSFAEQSDAELSGGFDRLLAIHTVTWTDKYRIKGVLGSGGQGVVFLADRIGACDVTIPVALKKFTPNRYATADDYTRDMRRIARIAGRLAVIKQDHLLDVHNFVERNNIYVMMMEWVDGFDLATLLDARSLERTRDCVSFDQWRHFCDVIFNVGAAQT